MTGRHGYVACVRESTGTLPDIDQVMPFSAADEACLKELREVLVRHAATDRFGIDLLHSHFPMADDELLLEETDVENRTQTISVIGRADVPAGAIFMNRRFAMAV